ncbi:GNAT family N-acetyltransferase [Bacillus horti]|uniref:RimJ/RimL family protein N-acetyltransferase n=1 Tax=Caldalkalibacillus horti TaxID=77523 RepID=A0ABT9VYN8_9BACI|nr:GNAT family protein [Bacillus horti]MDQ0165980.1 RimJ/RimL family protein N-acetyltransferase [Bacillus horti]
MFIEEKALRESLIGEHIRIEPMVESHIEGLYEIAKHESIWKHLSKDIHSIEDMKALVGEALGNKAAGREFPFVIFSTDTNQIIGSTRFLDISQANRNLEIGWTWYTPSVWGTQANNECKYLLLKYCFETLKTIRVQLKTDHLNVRSQKAIERIGGVREGVLRNHVVRKDGTFRHSVYFSIIENEWPLVKSRLEHLLTLVKDPTQYEKP